MVAGSSTLEPDEEVHVGLDGVSVRIASEVASMRIQYVKVEEVDTVLTITFAERAVEEGFLLHMMRVVPGGENDGFDPELENYELATRDYLCEGGVHDWSLNGANLTLNLTAEAGGSASY